MNERKIKKFELKDIIRKCIKTVLNENSVDSNIINKDLPNAAIIQRNIILNIIREEIQKILHEKKRKKKRNKTSNGLPVRHLGYIGVGPWHIHDQSMDISGEGGGD